MQESFLHFLFNILFCCIGVNSAFANGLGPHTESEIIRVRIERQLPLVRLSGFGLNFYDGDFKAVLPQALPRKREFSVRYENGNWVLSGSGESFVVRTPILKVDGQMNRLGLRWVSDRLLLVGRNQKIDVVSLLNLEEYLLGVVPSEMPPGWPQEALKAQAVSARSYALSLIAENKNNSFDLDDTILHQVYNLQNYNKLSDLLKKNVTEAVTSTVGLYLADKNGNAYRTYYHAHCGGSTEEPLAVWGQSQKYGRVKDERCGLDTHANWRYQLTASDFNLLRRELAIAEAFESWIFELSLSGQWTSGRVKNIVVRARNKNNSGIKTKSYSAEQFRQLLGYGKVRSGMFHLVGDQVSGYALTGRGLGHGVGLCQSGARYMARAGQKYIDILARYYPVARLSQLSYVIGRAQTEGESHEVQ